MKEAISIFILLFFPILYKMDKGWDGTKHPDYEQGLGVTIVWLICLFFALLIKFYINWWFVLKCACVSFTGFMLIFPYLMNWRLSYRFGFTPPRWLYILNHLSSTAVPDRWPAYRAMGWFGRMALWLTLFLLSVKWFTL